MSAMTTNLQKFTGKLIGVYQGSIREIKASMPSSFHIPKSLMPAVAAFVAVILLGAPAQAAYTPAYTPVPFGCVTAQVPDQIAIIGDVFTMVLNICVSNWITMMMIVIFIFLVAWGAVTGLFRRGKRRGR